MPAVIRPAGCFHHGTASRADSCDRLCASHRHRRAAGVRRQRPQDLVGALEPLGRILREAAQDDFRQRRGRVGVDGPRIGRLGLHALQQFLDRRVAVEWHRAGHHLVEDQPERVQVDAVIEGAAHPPAPGAM